MSTRDVTRFVRRCISDTCLDVRHGLRHIVRLPKFSVLVIFTLGIGIGTSTTIFSVVKTVLLDPLPYPNSEQLVKIVETAPADEAPGGVAEERTLMEVQRFFAWRAATKTLSQMAAYVSTSATITAADGASRAVVARVSPVIFRMLGARLTLGRTFGEADERPGTQVAVVSVGAWAAYFGSSTDVIGQTVVLDGTGYTIVGVVAEGFDFPAPETQFWVPFEQQAPTSGRETFVNVLGRLRDGVSLQEATAEANVIGLRTSNNPAAGDTASSAVSRYRVQGLHEQMTATVAPALRLFTVAACLIALIVAANVATLLLTRSTRDRAEMALRRALGASRGRVVRQVMIEAVMLGLGGVAVGLAFAYGGVELLKRMSRVEIPELFQLAARHQFGTAAVFPRVDDLRIDIRAFPFAMSVAVLVSVAAGLAPAWQIVADERRPVLGGGVITHLAAIPKGGLHWRNALVTGQLAVATLLLVVALLLIRSFGEMLQVPMGYDATKVLSFQLIAPQEYPATRKESLALELAARLSALPGVDAAGFASLPPLAGGAFAYGVFQPPGKSLPDMLNDPGAPQARAVSSDYLRAMGARLLEGRWFDERDGAEQEQVLLVTRAVARRYFGLRSPVGIQLRLPPGTRLWTIVGVVDDIHNGMPWEPAYSQFFMDTRQALRGMPRLPERMRETAALGFLSYAIRVSGDPTSVAPAVRAVLRELDRAATLDGLMPLRTITAGRMSRPRSYAVLAALLALIAALLGTIGVYSTVAYATVQRTREIGIRIALGAQRSDVFRLIVSHGAALASLGICAGLCGAFVLSRYLAGLLFGVTARDPLTYVTVGLLFFAVAVMASFRPAHRAARLDPATTIRSD